MPTRVSAAGSTGLALALLLCVRVAVSQEPAGNEGARHGASQADASASQPREVVNDLQREVKALEGEIARMREQLTKVDQQLERLKSVPGWGAPPAACDPPFFVDADGIKHFRWDCLDEAPSKSVDDRCSPPFHLLEDGTKLVKMECL
jgi:hypothetical protein